MTAQPDNLMLVNLRRIDAKIDALADRASSHDAELVQVRRQLALIVDEMAHERGARASIETRLDRIERRSQIAEGVT